MTMPGVRPRLIRGGWQNASASVLLCALSLLFAIFCQDVSVAQDGLESPELVVEHVVASEIHRAGSAALVGRVEQWKGLPETPLAQGYARALVDVAGGKVARARRTIERTLDLRNETNASSPLVAALLRLWLEVGIDRDGRVFLVANGGDPQAAFSVARAVDLAQSQRCDEAIGLLNDFEPKMSSTPDLLLLASEGWSRCGDPGRALDILSLGRGPEERREVDPRVAIRAGEILLRAGDVDSAALWCQAGLAASSGIPRQWHAASRCVTAANAMRGILPRSRREFINARRDALLDSALSVDLRVEAGFSAVWAAIRSRNLKIAGDALVLLGELDAVSRAAKSRQASSLLRAMTLTILERQPDARRLLDRVGPSETDPELAVLWGLASAAVQRGMGNPLAASTLLSEAATSARRAGRLGLLAEVEMERAFLARWEGRAQLAQRHALAALETWPGMDPRGGRATYLDPVFERRAMEFTLDLAGASRRAPEARVGRLLSLADQLRGAVAGPQDASEDLPDAARVRRSLAARDAALLYYLIGETKSYAWLVEAAGMRFAELPAGELLFDRLDRWREARASRESPGDLSTLFGGLLDSLMPDSGLLIAPDAFLVGVPWQVIEGPSQQPLGASFPLSIVPSLGLIVDPAGMAQRDRKKREGFLVIAAPQSSGWVASLGEEGQLPVEPLTLLEASDGDLPEINARYRRAPSILHLALPVECSGRGIDRLLLQLPAQTAESAGRSFSLGDVLRRDLGCDLLALAPEGGWSIAAGSRVRAGFQAVRNGAGAAIVPLGALSRSAASRFWPGYYHALELGESKAAAIRRAVASLPGVSLPAFEVVGHADTRLREPRQEQWPFWTSLGGALLIIGIVILRAIWRRKDPFDVEPPEE